MRLALIVLLSLAGPAHAEINAADSIEWQTIDSDVVVQGFVTGATKIARPSGYWWEITVQINESIKGGVKKSLRFGMRALMGEEPEQWRKNKTDLVLFLVPGKDRVDDHEDFARYDYALRRAMGGEHASAHQLGTDKAYTAAYDAITKPTDVLAAIRGAAKSTVTKSFRVDVPWNTPAMNALYGGSAVWLTVPVDAALEKQALAWIAEPDDTSAREQGVRALGHFKSKTNILHVKPLLSDDGYYSTSKDRVDYRIYAVRRAAHEVLAAWHVPHDTPLLEEPAPKRKK
jgi:hypothetical protein